jgi:hypothetical protein
MLSTFSLRARARGFRSACVATVAALSVGGAFSTAFAATITWVNPPAGKTYGRPAQVPLEVTVVPSSGKTIVKVDFLRNGTSTPILTVNAPGPYRGTWNINTNGTYTLTARVTENPGGTTQNSATRTITIANNQLPTASQVSPSAGDQYTTADEIWFEANASDTDGTVTLLEFRRGSTLIKSLTAPPWQWGQTLPAGTHQINVRATDNSGGVRTTSNRQISVIAAPPPPSVSITSPTSGATVASTGATVTATAAANGSASIDRVEFYYDGANLIGTAFGEPYSVPWAAPPVGSRTLTARAYDSFNSSTLSAAVPVTVAVPRAPPTITLTSPVSGSVLQPQPGGQSIAIAATAAATEPGATLTKVELFSDQTLLATLTSPPYQHTINSAQSGGYLIRAVATDSFGTTATALAYTVIDGSDTCDTAAPLSAPESKAMLEKFARTPIAFEANVGQSHPHVRYRAFGSGFNVLLAQDETVVNVADATGSGKGSAVRMAFVGADGNARVTGEQMQERRSHYLIGRDASRWHRDVPHFGQVRYSQIYPGIDYVFHANSGQLEYDFHVAPGAMETVGVAGTRMAFVAKLNQAGTSIAYATYLTGTTFEFEGNPPTQQYTEGYGIAVDGTGHAYVTGETLSTDFPVTPGAFRTTSGGGSGGYAVKLTRDGKALIYGTYLNVVRGWSIATDPAGNAYVVGGRGLVKVAPSGSSMVYEVLVGGSGGPFGGQDDGVAVKADSDGNAYVVGTAYSMDVATTPGAFQATRPNGTSSSGSGFLTKMNPTGTQALFTTYVGTQGMFYPRGLTLDAAGNIYVTGFADNNSSIPGFGGTGAPFTSYNLNTNFAGIQHAFVIKLNASGATPAFAARIGGGICNNFSCGSASTSGAGIAVDAQGNVWIGGTTTSNQIPLVKALYATYAASGNWPDLFAAKLSPTGTQMLFSTLLNGQVRGSGSPNGPGSSELRGIAVDSVGSAYVTGYTDKIDFPVTAGARPAPASGLIVQGFVTKINETKHTTTLLSANPNPGAVGTPVGLTAAVTGNPAYPAPAGNVEFRDGTTLLGTVPLSGTTAQLSVSLAGGSHSLSAKYVGDANGNASTGSLTLNVTDPLTPPTVTLTGIADGATLVANSGSAYSGGTMTLSAAAAAGNNLTQVRVVYPSGYTYWNLFQPSFSTVWAMQDFFVGFHTVYGMATDNLSHIGTSARRPPCASW